ncbi:hypothetical protein J6590_072006 [Homalodisca vitripennis]|nr:hypothetical protein J6590_072006 [Homalodisca vitripennis]
MGYITRPICARRAILVPKTPHLVPRKPDLTSWCPKLITSFQANPTSPDGLHNPPYLCSQSDSSAQNSSPRSKETRPHQLGYITRPICAH